MTRNCQRCGQPFEADWLDTLKKWANCCDTCKFRNFSDALGFPTPPDMLDQHTKHPTLTQEEYERKLKAMPEEGYGDAEMKG